MQGNKTGCILQVLLTTKTSKAIMNKARLIAAILLLITISGISYVQGVKSGREQRTHIHLPYDYPVGSTGDIMYIDSINSGNVYLEYYRPDLWKE